MLNMMQKNSKESTRDPNLFLEIKETIQNSKEKVAEAFADFEIVSALQRQLSWTHFKTIIYLNREAEEMREGIR